jgi:hypothetical protein
MVILKLDFEKAFHKIEHNALLEILRHKGFKTKWLKWMDMIMSSGTSSIMLNGVPRKTFHCKRGVCQGDPLSPLLFVLAVDLLQSILNKAKDAGIIQIPLSTSPNEDFPVIQYADDTFLIMEACPRHLFFLKALLNSIATSTRLHVNYQKSNIYSCNVSNEIMEILAKTFNCKIGTYPFTYMGLPMGFTKPRIDSFLPLIQKIEKRLSTTSLFLSQAGRLQMVNVVFTSLPTFYLCKLKIPSTVIKQIGTYRRHCIWRGVDPNATRPAQASWHLACRPKQKGGLGILHLKKHNEALQMKMLHKFLNKQDIPWVQLIWRNRYNDGSLPQMATMVCSGGKMF